MTPHFTRLSSNLTPLLLSLAISHAFVADAAADVILTGTAGAAGAAGTPPTGTGGAGQAGGNVQHTLTTGEASSKLTVTGGRGGDGGQGATEEMGQGTPWPPQSGPGGEGGAGGAVVARIDATRAAGAVLAETVASGGHAGDGGNDGCCAGGTAIGGHGGSATGIAEAGTGAGRATVRAVATGGNAGVSRDGGAAVAVGTGTSASGAVAGQVSAVGGIGGNGQANLYGGLTSNPGSGGSANATLTLVGLGLASGTVQATGGDAGGAYSGRGSGGAASATLQLRGAGATGTSTASNGHGGGGAATSVARADTTGAQLVDLTAVAHGGQFSNGRATVHIDSGYATTAAGSAAITGTAYADGGPYGEGTRWNTASLTLLGTGDVTGLGEARGNPAWDIGSCYGSCGPGGDALSTGLAATRSGKVSLTVLAMGGTDYGDFGFPGGSARATASGSSLFGAVTVRAEARSHDYSSALTSAAEASGSAAGAGNAASVEARHAATYTAYHARAQANTAGRGADARAVAIGEGPQGGSVLAQAGASADAAGAALANGRVQITSASSNATAASYASVNGIGYAMPALDSLVGAVSYANADLTADGVTTLLAATTQLAASGVTWHDAGVMAAATGGSVFNAVTEGSYLLNASSGEHLVLGLFGGQGYGGDNYSLSFSVSHNGLQIFTRDLSGDQLATFFTNKLIDLGVVSYTGWQSLVVTADWSMGAGGGYGYQYVLGTSPVPEPGAWLSMLLGLGALGTLRTVARRRQQ